MIYWFSEKIQKKTRESRNQLELISRSTTDKSIAIDLLATLVVDNYNVIG